jgi:hypothetical protein
MEVIMSNRAAPAAFSELLQKAVSEPGLISSAYTQFHHFSLGNMLLAAFQCTTRGLAFGPLATYPRWQELGRQVRKGERAIVLCQPVVVPREARDQRAQGATGTERANVEPNRIVRFIYRANWFVLGQTDGADVSPGTLPGWDRTRALEALHVVEVPYSSIDGNVMGYARKREIAISPINPLPHKTLCHELAHVLLGHDSGAGVGVGEGVGVGVGVGDGVGEGVGVGVGVAVGEGEFDGVGVGVGVGVAGCATDTLLLPVEP